jgi:hypothetical protein
MDFDSRKKIDLNEVPPIKIERPETVEEVARAIWGIIERFNEKEPWDMALQICVSIQLIWKGIDFLLEKGEIEVVPGQDISNRSDRCQFRLVNDLP